MQGWGPGSSQPAKNRGIEKKANVYTAAERARQQRARHEYRLTLEKDISNLQRKLRQEIDTRKALERAFRRTLGVLPRFSPRLSPKVQELLAEVAVLEEEVINLEECIVSLRQGLYNEAVYFSASKLQKESNSDSDSVAAKEPSRKSGTKTKRNSVIAKLLPPVVENKSEECSIMQKSGVGDESCKVGTDGVSGRHHGHVFQQNCNNKPDLCLEVGSSRPIYKSLVKHETCLEKENQQKIMDKPSKIWPQIPDATINDPKKVLGMSNGETVEPNLLSEEMVWCLSSVFLKLSKQGLFSDCETSSTISHSTLSSAWSFTSKNSMSCNVSRDVTEEIEFVDPYDVNTESTIKDVGPYQYYQEVTAEAVDYSRIPKSAAFLKKLMTLIEKLRMVDLRGLTHYQKLSFWINIYNSCMMHAFLEHGIPNSPQKVVALMGKAAINVGGHLLSALAIEHFILRLPCDLKNAGGNTKEADSLMCSTYGLEWPEPLVSFALCCGSWSSPAVRIYTPHEVQNELEIAKTEYLQAAIGVTPTRVMIPKLLDWYMRDFAKDAESLIDWISKQLPNTLGKSLQKCLANTQGKSVPEVLEIMPYDFNFRYLFAVQPMLAYS